MVIPSESICNAISIGVLSDVDEIEYFRENKDGSICVKFPLKWVKINPGSIPDPNKPKRVMSEEQKEKMKQALKKYRESQKK